MSDFKNSVSDCNTNYKNTHYVGGPQINGNQSNACKECSSEVNPEAGGISKEIYEKFQRLKERREQLTKQTTYRRMKNIQKNVFKTVRENFTHPDEINILQKHGISFQESEKKSKGKMIEITSSGTDNSVTCEEQWEELKPLLTINDHLQGVNHGRYGPKTKLEEKINDALACGSYELAEKLSDHLANREFGTKISAAVNAQNYLKRKKIEEMNEKKKKKKLNWGFEAKERWQMKGNL